MASATVPVGDLLREWRQRRRLSQLDLACEADISTRHLSFVETGRAQPSREMVLHLAERLDVPLRERNALLLAAGYAPAFSERPLNDPALDQARDAIELVLKAHEPYPALAIDRHWTMVAANGALAGMLEGVDLALLQPPVNVLRLSLHPNGVAPRILNLGEWRAHLLGRLRRQIEIVPDAKLIALSAELHGYPVVAEDHASVDGSAVVVPLRFAIGGGVVLNLFSTTMVFGSPVDITLSELAIESFFPADAPSARFLKINVQSATEGNSRSAPSSSR